MSISIKTVPGNDAARIFIIEGASPKFPRDEEYEFTDSNDAKKSGYYIAGKALSNPHAISVTVMRSDSIPGYTGKSYDCIQIELKAAFMWNSNVKAKDGTTTNETVAQRYAQILEREYIDGTSVTYQAPTSQSQQAKADTSILNLVKGHLTERLARAVDKETELTRRKNEEGYKPTVFDTIKIHGGSVSAISYHNGVLTCAFSDTCGGSGCYNNSTLATEAGVKAELRPEFKFIKQFEFIKQ